MSNESFSRAIEFVDRQCRRLIEQHPGYYPMYTVKGQWPADAEAWTHWCDGFYPGIFWLLHQHTRAPFWRERAEAYTKPLEPRKLDRNVHDLGFIFNSTYLRWYGLTGDQELHDVVVQAGRTLALRRQRGGYLASFIGPESLFIDIMMNVGLILWTANETGDAALREIALEHCRTTARYLVRADGGTAHEGIFDVNTGQFLRESTHQGWSAASTWTRGLAWALYGFTTIHRLSGEAEFLEVARRCADCYLRRAPADLVPWWDFDIPDDGPRLFDSSAAAIAASGFFDLAEAIGPGQDGERYRQAARTALTTLSSDAFLARSRPEWEGILLHGIYHYHKGLGVDESVAWGDYFFVEALVKALQ
ncbi:MAG: glycoside hydrolase family 88 protein, partial [Gemmataceae bacterium]